MSAALPLVSGDRQTPWRSELPGRWGMAPLKAVATINRRKLEEGRDPELAIRYIDISGVDSLGTITSTTDMPFASAPSRARRLPEMGDTIVSCVRTYLRAIAFIDELPVEAVLVCSTGFAVVHPGPAVVPRFLFYWLRSDLVVDEICARSVGVSYPAINPADFAGLPTPQPDIGEQRAIADFLDRKTAAIDALIAKKERLIELLEEKRQALITQAVTKGLDPTVPMKDSGIEWLGPIPAHWRLVRVKHAMSRIVDCPHSTPAYSEDGDYPAIRTADVERGRLLLERARCVDESTYHERVQRMVPREDDILYSREGERFGMAALVPEGVQLCLAQRMMIFRVASTNDPRFLMWVLNASSTYHQVKTDTVGATSPRINIPTIANAWLALPPRPEQTEVADALISLLVRSDQLAGTVREHIERLREYRQALITAAVTGKIDVTRP